MTIADSHLSPSTLAFPCFDGLYLPKQENEFVHKILDELDAYQQKGNHKSVLLFPPLPSRLRYLIHKTTENHPDLTTFSVGEGWCRRVVVCYFELRGEVEEDSDLESNSSLNEEPPMPRGRGEMARAAKPKSTPLRNRGPRRPDKALYVPRAARERLSFHGSPAGPPRVPSPGSCGCSQSTASSTTSGPCPCCPCSFCSDATEVTRSSSVTDQESSPVPSASHSLPDSTGDSAAADSPPSCPQDRQEDVLLKLCEAARCPSPPAWDQTISYFMYMTLEEACSGVPDSPHTTETSGAETCGAETCVEETCVEETCVEETCVEETSVEETCVEETSIEETCVEETCIEDGTADFSEEIMAHLKETEDVFVEHAHNDYSSFENVWINQDEFGHVIEIYDFPAMFKTDDLLDAFTEYSDGGMKIKWVDNTHALGVFSSESAALHALSIRHPLLKTRTLSKGSKKAKGKAIRRAEFLQPVKERPRTDSAVARRMVTRALGLQRGGGRALRY